VDDASDQPRHWYTTNLVGVPAPVLTSAAFNANPVPLSIAGARETHPGLFSLLERSDGLASAAEVFVHYLDIAFDLRRPTPAERSPSGPGAATAEQRRWRSSWRKLLQGWGMDANGPAGAVLKGWVESRFGLVPSFHKAPLARFPSAPWMAYLEEKASSRFHNNNIHQQLDLLYEFCQWALGRHAPAGLDTTGRHARLWRGSSHCEEQLVAGSLRQRECTVRLNNVVSFSLSPEQAGCFGDWVFEVRVPLCKVLVFPGLLPGHVLQGEQEVLALGGDYTLVARYA
jgi:NAD+--dinitrogen-reductase ADP-D-ribosyltransferase